MSDTVKTEQGQGAGPTRRRTRSWLLVGAAVGIGALVTSAWSYRTVDGAGTAVADTLLGYDSTSPGLVGVLGPLMFALITGLAGTFTACNVAVLGALMPIAAADGRRRRVAVARPVAWFTGSAVVVSAAYGAIGVLLGDKLPQLSGGTILGMPSPLAQSSVVFGVLGLGLVAMGIMMLGLFATPLERLDNRFPAGRLVILGAMVGAFLVGRPFPLFRELFAYAAEEGRPLLGALLFAAQSLGNVILVVGLSLLLAVLLRGRARAWVLEHGARAGAVVMVAAGTFLFLYWVFRVPSAFGLGWYPTIPLQ